MPSPGDVESVTVTWMDGKQETYPCTTVTLLPHGVLQLKTVYKSGIGFGDQVISERGIPLATMRIYSINRAA
jgi:hypothetical protein